MTRADEFEQLRYDEPRGPGGAAPTAIEADICVYGGTSAGVAAAVQAARMGQRVVLAEFGRRVGGMSASGLGATDAKKKSDIGGLAREFYRAIGAHYGEPEKWTFEPHVAEAIFTSMLHEAGVPVRFLQHLAAVRKDGQRVTAIEMEDGTVYRAKVFIDCTYEGDLMAMAGCAFHVGRESNATYGETGNGIQFGHKYNNFDLAIDPYVTPGVPSSGLLPCVEASELGVNGHGDHRVQAYNFRLCLTNAAGNRKPFPKPADYDPWRYELLGRYIDAGGWRKIQHWYEPTVRLALETNMPHAKTDMNNRGGFSTDHIGANDAWPTGDYATRQRLFQDHVNYTMGLLWFCAHDPRVPAFVHEDLAEWGLAADEFTATGGWPHQLYVREGRRLVGQLVMTEHQCMGRQPVQDPIGLASYWMDSHHTRRVVVDGRALNEGDVQVPVENPYGVSLRSITPRPEQCTNLLVPVALSASHIAYGSIRMEPVFMVLGQSAATVAAMAVENESTVQQVSYDELRGQLLGQGQVLEWTGKA